MLSRVYSILFWTALCAGCLVLFVGAAILFAVVGPFDSQRRVQHLYSCFWAQTFFYFNPLMSMRVEGRSKLPWRSGGVLVANHESLGDILVLFGLYRPFKWVSKASVFKVPLIGWNMWFNRYIPLLRRNRESIQKMMVTCEGWLRCGVPILLFPEGTRSLDGQVQPFKDGAFTLATRVGCPVYPLVITGTRNLLPKHGLRVQVGEQCVLRVLDPVDPAEFGGDVPRLRDHVRDLIVAEKAAMHGTGKHKRSAVA